MIMGDVIDGRLSPGDPMNLRASDEELRGVDPLTRARARMEAGEAAERHAADERSAQRREQWADQLAAQQMRDRVEIFQTGHLQREVDAVRAQAEQQRQGRIAELRAELDRLTGAGEWRVPDAQSVTDAQLRRNTEGDRAWRNGPCMRQRQAALRAQLAREQEITRSGPPQRPAAAGPPPRSAASGGPAPAGPPPRRELPPLARPDLAHLLPGDW
jgi:hypothetical protein